MGTNPNLPDGDQTVGLSEWIQGLVHEVNREANFYRLVLADPRTPSSVKFLIGAALIYWVSPIDLIPDFIPIIGQLDDVIIVPVLIFLALRLVPQEVLDDCRAKVNEEDK